MLGIAIYTLFFPKPYIFTKLTNMLDTGRIPITGNALAWYRQGLASATAGRFEQAVALYNQVIGVRPDFWEAWYERGLVFDELGLYAETIASYDRALVLEPPTNAIVEVWFHRAMALHYGIGDYELAMQGYDYALQLTPTHAQAWHHRGNILLYELAQPSAALVSYDRSLQHQPDHAPTWRNRGNALMELAQHTDALLSYDRALAINPEDQIASQGRQLAAQSCNLREFSEGTTQTNWYGEGFTATPVAGHPRLPDFTVPPVMLLVQPRLTVVDESGSREISLDKEQYTIGRDPRNDICLRSKFASRFHAVLHRVEPCDGQYGQYGYSVQDGDVAGNPSTNGLQINGTRSSQQELRSGDVITFGPRTMATFSF
jgi:tetratricopeptide (TPR) repeat protein